MCGVWERMIEGAGHGERGGMVSWRRRVPKPRVEVQEGERENWSKMMRWGLTITKVVGVELLRTALDTIILSPQQFW